MNPPNTTDNDNTSHSPAVSKEERIATDRWTAGTTMPVSNNNSNSPKDALGAVEKTEIKLSASKNQRRWSNDSDGASSKDSSCSSYSPPRKKLKTVPIGGGGSVSCGGLHDSSGATTNSSSSSPMTLLTLGSALVHARRASLSSGQQQSSPVVVVGGEAGAASVKRRRSSASISDRNFHCEILTDTLRLASNNNTEDQDQEAPQHPEGEGKAVTAAPDNNDLGYEPVVDLGYNTEEPSSTTTALAADLGYGEDSAPTERRPQQDSRPSRYLRRNSFVIHEGMGRAGNFPWAAMDFLYQHPPGASRDSFLQDRRLSAESSS